jgi:L-lactate dehydrogenase (cytochrome)
MKAAAVIDYRELARRRLPHFLFEYIDGGSCAEATLRRNVSDLEKVALRQRVLRDVSVLDLSTNLFGQRMALPVVLAPVGLAGLNARRGEVQAARTAQAAGIPFCLSTVSACPLEEVARDVRSGLAGAAGLFGTARRLGQGLLKPRWAWDVGICGRPHTLGNIAPLLGPNTGLEDFFAWMRNNFDPSVTWKDLEWIRRQWKGPLIIKGILDVHDARTAADLGAEGIVVSNHGGRQLDGTPSTVSALHAIAAAVGDRLTVLADGGIRSGLDVVRMLALGAKGVLLGRAWAYALAAAGEAGVSHMLDLVAAEIRVALSLTGCTRVTDIRDDILVQDSRQNLCDASTKIRNE